VVNSGDWAFGFRLAERSFEDSENHAKFNAKTLTSAFTF
jgi:hypothetical protein